MGSTSIGRADFGPFVPYGTGFVTVSPLAPGDEIAFQHIVTAKHVIEDIQSDIVWVRVNERSGRAETLPTQKSSWVFHPNPQIDVAVCPSRIPQERFDILHIPLHENVLTEEVISVNDIGTGDDVYVAGMFIARIGEVKNLPIVRTGTIAAMLEEKLKTEYGYHDAYLVEARSIDGLSGSPVFVHMAPWRTTYETNEKGERRAVPKMSAGSNHYFMGMMLGHHEVVTPEGGVELHQTGVPKASLRMPCGLRRQ